MARACVVVEAVREERGVGTWSDMTRQTTQHSLHTQYYRRLAGAIRAEAKFNEHTAIHVQ